MSYTTDPALDQQHKELSAAWARMRPLLPLRDFVSWIAFGLELPVAGDEGYLSDQIGERIASDDGSGRSRVNRVGLPFHVRPRSKQGLSLSNRGAANPEDAGIYYDELSQCAAIVTPRGHCLGTQLQPKGTSCGIIQRMGPYVLNRASTISTAWRVANGFDANTTASRLMSTKANGLASFPAVVGLATYLQRYFLAEKGAKSWHANLGWVAAGERFARQAMIVDAARRYWPNERVITNARRRDVPELDGLEIDVWIPALRLGIEHQGQQHYQAVSAWGGEQSLARTKANDARKRKLCKQHGIGLYEIRYDEPLDDGYLFQRFADWTHSAAQA